MKIGFAPYLSEEVPYAAALIALEDDLNNYFKNRSFGDGLSEIYIGIIVISPQFMQFFKPRAPKYSKKSILEYDIKFDFELLKKANEQEFIKIVRIEILESFNMLDGLMSKIEQFDFAGFKSDLQLFQANK
jgi:hypothetical protein